MPASPFLEIVQPKLVVGEGRDEVRFFQSLLKHLRVTDVQVVDYGGKQKLKAFLAALLRIPGFASLQALGITRDADDDSAGALQSIDSALSASALPATLRVARFVMPGPDVPGALESLCIQPILASPIGACIETFVLCTAEAGMKQHWSVLAGC